MKQIIVFGSGEIAELAHFYFKLQGKVEVVAFTVDDDFCKSESFNALPLVPFSKAAAQYPPNQYGAFVALSYAQMNRLREQKFQQLKKLGYSLFSYVSPDCTRLTEQIGENCFILEDNTLQPFSKIGNNVTLWSGNHIGHHSEIGDNCFITSHVVVSGGVKIGKNSFIGVNATLRDHITLGEATMIGAGALVTKSTTDKQVVRAPKSETLKITSDDIPRI